VEGNVPEKVETMRDGSILDAALISPSAGTLQFAEIRVCSCLISFTDLMMLRWDDEIRFLEAEKHKK